MSPIFNSQDHISRRIRDSERCQTKHNLNSKHTQPSVWLYPRLARFLSVRGMEFMYDSLYSFVNNDENSITSDLSLEDLLALCKTLPLEIHLVNMLINALRAHCIDGRFVIEVEEEHLAPYFPSQLHHSKSLSVLRAAALAQMGCFSVGAVLCPIGVHPLAYAGLATDMSSLTESQVIQVISADALAASEGEGLIYGQLLVLGYSERHSMYSRDRERRETMVVGGANSTLVLRRRAIAGTHLEMAE